MEAGVGVERFEEHVCKAAAEDSGWTVAEAKGGVEWVSDCGFVGIRSEGERRGYDEVVG